MNNIDVSTIHLSKANFRALKRLSKGVQPDKKAGNYLCSLRLAEWSLSLLAYGITPAGIEYLEHKHAARADHWWTRGLAIAAILISLAALLLELDDRGHLDWLKPEKTPAAQSMSIQSESQ